MFKNHKARIFEYPIGEKIEITPDTYNDFNNQIISTDIDCTL